MGAGALDTVEYQVAFERPTTEVGEPVAGHVRLLCRLAQALDVTRKALAPYLVAMDGLYRQGAAAAAPPQKRPRGTPTCRFCQASGSLIVADYVSVCTQCGFENDSCRIRDDAEHLPPYKPGLHHYGGAVDDPAPQGPSYAAADAVRKQLRLLTSQGFLTVEQEGRAAVVAALYVAEHRVKRRQLVPTIAAAGAVYALLETWAGNMVEINVVRGGVWSKEYVLAPRPSSAKKKKTNVC